MNEQFQKAIANLPDLLKQLCKSPAKLRDALGKMPDKGVYVFYENGKPIYVGRSNRLKQRILEHGRNCSTHNSAPFAFNLAKQKAERQGIDINRFRTELEKDEKFAPFFSNAKKRVTKMSVRVVGTNDPIKQALFEIYATIALNTKFNDFDTH